MKNSDQEFYGQHSDEKILYVAKPHPYAIMAAYLKVLAGVMIITLSFLLIPFDLIYPSLEAMIRPIGLLVSAAILILGILTIQKMERVNKTYITDRRIVRFHAHNPFATTTRSLSWNDAVKVKTFPPNLVFKMLKIGTVVVHSGTSVLTQDAKVSQNMVSADDIEINEIYYYKDLGNYIDKILFMYKQKPAELAKIRPFVPQPKGKRY